MSAIQIEIVLAGCLKGLEGTAIAKLNREYICFALAHATLCYLLDRLAHAEVFTLAHVAHLGLFHVLRRQIRHEPEDKRLNSASEKLLSHYGHG